MMHSDERSPGAPSISWEEGRVQSTDDVIARCRGQSVLFARTLSRLELQALELPPARLGQCRANIWRNQNFETFEVLLRPFLTYAGLEVEYRLGGYDDTLDFERWTPAEVEVVWLDSSRYRGRMAFADWLEWLGARVRDLRSRTSAPILLASWDAWAAEEGSRRLAALADGIPGVHVVDLEAACAEEDTALLDPRVAKVAGTPISRLAQAVLARRLGCHWLPGLLLPPIKAVAVDLDNTLHSGVLGEEGPVGVRLEPGHVLLQTALRTLKDRGIFLALISRNELEDVESLFAQRTDYPLRWDDFSVVEVSWGSKADAVARVARQLRIAPDAVLFLDDNPGELVSVAAGCPGVHPLFASPDGDQTRLALHYYPGLWRGSVSADDARRVEDMRANVQRDKLLGEGHDEERYFQDLGVVLTVRHDAIADVPRLAELCRKTNQFNLALRRYNEADLAAFMARDDACVAAVSLSDRLSDSGLIAALVAVREGGRLTVLELCISCRALGRRLEDAIVLSALRCSALFPESEEVVFETAEGPRNQPARGWLEGLRDRLEAGKSTGDDRLSADRIGGFTLARGIEVIKE